MKKMQLLNYVGQAKQRIALLCLLAFLFAGNSVAAEGSEIEGDNKNWPDTITLASGDVGTKISTFTEEDGVCYQALNAGDSLWLPTGSKVNSAVDMANAITKGETMTFVRVKALKESDVKIKSDVHWCTLCYPYDLTIDNSSQISAYTVSDVNANGELVLQHIVEDEPEITLSAFTPVLFYAESEVTLKATPTENEMVSVASVPVHQEGNLLVGVNGDVDNPSSGVTINQRNQYVLQKHGDKVAFYYVDTNNSKNVSPYRCYLEIPNSVNSLNARPASFEILVKSTSTSIRSTTSMINIADALNAGVIYDMSGKEVSRMQKGIVYICNGLKLIVK